MTLQEAEAITGKLGEPSKMPCLSWSISARKCKTGSKLAKVKGSICSGCYALRGNYTFPVVRDAMARRLRGLRNPRWPEAMAVEIRAKSSNNYFRLFDSGDFQNEKHIDKVVALAKLIPDFLIWAPSKEIGMVSAWIKKNGPLPANLNVRLSAFMIDSPGPVELAKRLGCTVSEVRTDAASCPAPSQGNKCLTCRKCWDSNVMTVSYKKH